MVYDLTEIELVDDTDPFDYVLTISSGRSIIGTSADLDTINSFN